MTSNTESASQKVVKDDLFSQGWLDRHIHAVVSQIAALPESQRPHLVGPRAAAMRGFDWTPFSTDSSTNA